MLKKIFSAAIFVLLLISAQIVDAYDWNKVQRVNSKSDLANYIENQRREGHIEIPVILTNGLTVSAQELASLCSSSRVSQEIFDNDGQNLCVVFTLEDYPGTRVANAYINGDKSALTPDELKLYDVALEIVKDADQYEDEISKAMAIYYEIMDRTTYFNDDNTIANQPRFVTALGAIIDGKSNCQGYSDAFYMLGRMCGLNVGKMGGQAGGGFHMWNTITYKDGKTYFIDLTWSDGRIQYEGKSYPLLIYFNAPAEIMQYTHQWDLALAPPNLQPSIDEKYSYCGYWDTNLARTNTAEAGLQLLAKKIGVDNENWFSVMTPFDQRYISNAQQATEYFSHEVNRNVFLSIEQYGKYMFFTAYAR